MKKFLILFLAIGFLINNGTVFAQNAQKGFVDYEKTSNSEKKEFLLVLPMDENFFSNYPYNYSMILNSISTDIINLYNETDNINAITIDSLIYRIKNNRQEHLFNNVISLFKGKGLIDYQSLSKLCDNLGTSKVLLVTGDFSAFKFICKPHTGFQLDLIEPALIKPAYEINTFVVLADPYQGKVIWDKTFEKSFTVDSPQFNIQQKSMSISNLRKFSHNVASWTVEDTEKLLFPQAPVTSVNAQVIKTKSPKTILTNAKNTITTKSSNTFSTINRYVKTKF